MITRVPNANQNFGTNRCRPLSPNSVHKRVYSAEIGTVWKQGTEGNG